MRPVRSLTTRLVAWFTLMAATVLLGLGWALGMAIEAHFVDMDRDVLDSHLRVIQQQLADTGALEVAHVGHAIDAATGGHHDLKVAVRSADGQPQVLYRSPAIEFPEHWPATDRDPVFDWTHAGRSYRAIWAPWRTASGEAVQVAVALDIHHHAEFMAGFRHTLWSVVAGAVLLMTALGGWVVHRGLAPLRLIGRRAASVTASRLNERLPEAEFPAELAAVAVSLNGMLARLEDAFARLSQFSSDLAHELRTPISNLMTQTQVALTQARDASTYQEILASNAEELDRLSRMIADMLFLAKADHGLILPRREPVQLDHEVAALFDFFEALAEEGQVLLNLSGQAQISGDRLMIRRALSNLLSNAIRYTPPGGRIQVHLAGRDDGVLLRVLNTGAAIAPTHLVHLFERFYRADPAREPHGGTGLGLAITQAIVLAHQGRISVTSSDAGTCFEIWLPAQLT